MSLLGRATVAELLDFESIEHGRDKDRAIRERFGVSPACYQLVLNRVIDLPEAMVVAPALTRALVARRDRLRSVRVAAYGEGAVGTRNSSQRELALDHRRSA